MPTLATGIRPLAASTLCGLLTGCLTVADFAQQLPVVQPPEVHAEQRRPAFESSPRHATPAPQPVNLDFRVLDGRATIGSREYVLDVRDRPVITALGGKVYRMELTLRRNSRSSLRGDETLTTHFYYDGVELTFFGDKNRNQHFDRHESGVRHIIGHTREIITQGNRRYMKARELKVTLNSRHINSFHLLKTLEMRLMFQAER